MAEFRNATLQAAWEIVEAHYHRLCRCGNNGGGDCDWCDELAMFRCIMAEADDKEKETADD